MTKKIRVNPRKSAAKSLLIFCLAISTAAHMPVAAEEPYPPPEPRHTYFNQTTTREITRGVRLIESRRVVEGGHLDVFVLEVPLNDPYIELSVFNSSEYGLKEHTTRLIEANGAIAGINGDFFGLAGTHSIPLGLEVDDNGAVSAASGFNYPDNRNATFFIDEYGMAFIEFIQTNVAFYNNGARHIDVGAVNKSAAVEWPAAFTAEAMRNTADIDARVENVVKIVAENGVITYISAPGETVYIPENGFIIALPAQTFERYANVVAVGQTAYLYVSASVGLDTIRRAVSGAGLILENGVFSNEGATPGGRHPRTAIGISEDGQTAILMVIDGRTHSLGATNAETAELMLEFGAFNAMQLDGGGSSIMAAANDPWRAPVVQNRPENNFQRRVINAVGVRENAPLGNMVALDFEIARTAFMTDVSNPVTVFGRDEFRNRIEIDPLAVEIIANGAVVSGTNITPYSETVELTVIYGEFFVNRTVLARGISRITPAQRVIHTAPGEETELAFNAHSADGLALYMPLRNTEITVYPPGLGVAENGVFTAQQEGQGYIRAYMNGAEAFIAVSSAEVTVVEENVGMVPIHGFSALDVPAVSREADGVNGFRVGLYGDGSGRTVLANVRDANGELHTAEFSRTLDFTGHQYITAYLPRDIAQPVRLESLTTVRQPMQFFRAVFITSLYGVFFDEAEVPQELYVPETPPDVIVTNERFESLQAFLDSIYGEPLTEINISAQGGGITAANPQQWAEILAALENSERNVIVNLDSGPLTFEHRSEFDMLISMLRQAVLEGKTVVVTHPGWWLAAQTGVWFFRG